MIQNTHYKSIHRKFKVLCRIHLFLQIRTKHDFHLSPNYLLSDYQTFLKQCKCLEKWMYSRTTQMTSKKLLRIKFNRKRIFQTKIPGDSLPASLFRRPRVLTFDSLWASWILTDQFRPTKSLSFFWLIWWYGFHPLRGATSCSDLFGYSMLFRSTIRLPESSPPKVLTNLWALGVCGKARSPLRSLHQSRLKHGCIGLWFPFRLHAQDFKNQEEAHWNKKHKLTQLSKWTVCTALAPGLKSGMVKIPTKCIQMSRT